MVIHAMPVRNSPGRPHLPKRVRSGPAVGFDHARPHRIGRSAQSRTHVPLQSSLHLDRTFGPLEPSPGYGPAVSSGISVRSSPLVEVLDVLLEDEVVDEVVDDDELVVELEPSPSELPHAASTAAPAPIPM